MKEYISLFLQSPDRVKSFIRTLEKLEGDGIKLSLRINKYYTCIEAVGKDGSTEQSISRILQELRNQFGGPHVVSGDVSSRELLFNTLRDFHYSIVCAESCTGGAMGKRLTSLSGSSEVFWGSLVTYSEDAKTKIIKVPRKIIENHGAVSLECVRAMTEGALEVSGADIGIGVSGIAGPGGGTPQKPRGTVWIGISGGGRKFQGFHFLFSGDRHEVRRKTVISGLLYTYWYLQEPSMIADRSK